MHRPRCYFYYLSHGHIILKVFLLSSLLLVLNATVHAQQVALNKSGADSLRALANRSQGTEKAEHLLHLAKFYIDTDVVQAKLLLEESYKTCGETKNDTALIKLVVKFSPVLCDAGERELARHYLVLLRDKKFDPALPVKFDLMIWRALTDIHYWYLTDYDSCAFYAQKYIEHAADSNDIAMGYMELAAAQNELGDNIKALETYHIAQSYLSSKHADPASLAWLYNNLGMLYSDERELKKSEEYYLKAFEYGKISKKVSVELSPLNNLGVLYNWLGDYDKSLHYLSLAAERLPAYDDVWAVGNNHMNIGHTMILAGRPAEGLERVKEALKIFSKMKDDYMIAVTRIQLAEGYRQLHRYPEAEKEALLALAWDKEKGYGEVVKDSYEELYQIYRDMRKYQQAFEFQNKYLTIVDSLNKLERKTKFGLLEKNYEISQQEKIRKELERENEVHQAKARTDRVTRIALVSGSLVLAVTAIIAVVGYRRSRIQNKKIEEQAEQLREAAKTKARFFANVSHELRTPVTLLNGMLELMHEKRRGDDSEKMEIALGSSRRLQSMLNEVLDLSRVESGKWELNPKPKEIFPLISRIVLAFESLTVKKNLTLEFDASPLRGLVVNLDEDKFEKIINNLIYNAIKFNHEHGWIKVRGNRTDTSIVIQVEDSGIGIPQNELPHIFDRFYQSTTTERLNSQGIGIGLSLVREFTALHGGEISVTSEPGKGSCFTLQLPIAGVGSAAELPEDEAAEVPEVTFNNFQQKPVVLVVEDNDEMRFYLREIFGDELIIAEARNGREGLAWLKTNRPDMIISDVMMPEMDGYEFLSQLKQSATYRGIPVIMLTARAAEEDLLQGLGLGVDDYIIKPFNARELKIRVHNLLTNQDIRRAWHQKPIEQDELTPADTGDPILLEKIKEFVEANADNSAIGIADLGEHLAMSERQVYRKTATITGMSPAQLIKEIRLRIAYKLLLERKVSKVSDLARRVGFENTSYFSRQFLERYGKRPADLL